MSEGCIVAEKAGNGGDPDPAERRRPVSVMNLKEGTMATASTGDTMSPQLLRVARRGLGSISRSGDPLPEPSRRKSRMVEISMSGSGEGLGWAIDRGYSTMKRSQTIAWGLKISR